MPFIEMLLLQLITPLLIAVTAFVYSCVLLEPGEIFHALYHILRRLFKTDEREREGLGPHPLFKMIMYCERCVAGQMAFWIFLICLRNDYLSYPWLVFFHIFFVAESIFLAMILKHHFKSYV